MDILFYKYFNKDLENFTEEQINWHYETYGIYEHHRIKNIRDVKKIFFNFSFEIYKKKHVDLINYNTDFLLIQHFIEYGINEGREFNTKEEMEKFNIKKYKEEHQDCKDMSYIELYINYFEKINTIEKLGFIIIRHINSNLTNCYWNECYRCIRKLYNNKIIIIDDNSNYKYVNNEQELINCEIIKSEYHGRGELLPYYYFYKYHFFEKAVIIHDSTFLNVYIDFRVYGEAKPIWHFLHYWDNEKDELYLINKLNNKNELINFYYQKDKWYGCFGGQSVIDFYFLKYIVEKYNLFNLLDFITNREQRKCIERILPLIYTYEISLLSKLPSILGSIQDYLPWGNTYQMYLDEKKKIKIMENILLKFGQVDNLLCG